MMELMDDEGSVVINKGAASLFSIVRQYDLLRRSCTTKTAGNPHDGNACEWDRFFGFKTIIMPEFRPRSAG